MPHGGGQLSQQKQLSAIKEDLSHQRRRSEEANSRTSAASFHNELIPSSS
jgi:hypothetical protein